MTDSPSAISANIFQVRNADGDYELYFDRVSARRVVWTIAGARSICAMTTATPARFTDPSVCAGTPSRRGAPERGRARTRSACGGQGDGKTRNGPCRKIRSCGSAMRVAGARKPSFAGSDPLCDKLAGVGTLFRGQSRSCSRILRRWASRAISVAGAAAQSTRQAREWLDSVGIGVDNRGSSNSVSTPFPCRELVRRSIWAW